MSQELVFTIEFKSLAKFLENIEIISHARWIVIGIDYLFNLYYWLPKSVENSERLQTIGFIRVISETTRIEILWVHLESCNQVLTILFFFFIEI